ncbi:hypothetical protein ABU186_01855 [Weissella paramesenteroides]
MKNKKEKTFKVFMFISSYMPLYIFILIARFNHMFSIFRFYKGGFKIANWFELFLNVSLVGLILFSLFVVNILTSTKATAHNIVAKHIEPTRDTTISYIATYIVPMTSLVNSGLTVNALVANAGLFVLIGVLYVKLNLVYLNPLMVLRGYVPYFAGQQIIISNIEYRKLKDFSQNRWNGTHISSRIILLRKQDNN